MNNKGFIPARRGLLEHLKDMKSREVKLFEAYRLLADHRTAICWESLDALGKICGWSADTVSIVRRELIVRKFIVPNKQGLSGVWIPKFPNTETKKKGFVNAPIWAKEFTQINWVTPRETSEGDPPRNLRGSSISSKESKHRSKHKELEPKSKTESKSKSRLKTRSKPQAKSNPKSLKTKNNFKTKTMELTQGGESEGGPYQFQKTENTSKLSPTKELQPLKSLSALSYTTGQNTQNTPNTAKNKDLQPAKNKELECKKAENMLGGQEMKAVLAQIKTSHRVFEKKILAKLGGIMGQWKNWGLSNVSESRTHRGQNPVAAYLNLFRTEGMVERLNKLSPTKELRLLESLSEIALGKAKFNGQPMVCSVEDFLEAIQEVNKRGLRRPITNHNYLKQVVLTHNFKTKRRAPRIMRYGKKTSTTRRKGWYQ